MKRKLLCVAALFVAFPVLLSAQRGSLQGTVTDDDGPVAGARIEIVGTTRGAVTTVNGTYIITGLRAGTTTIRISSLGKQTVETEIAISINSTATFDVKLEDEVGEDGEIVRIVETRIKRVNADVSGKVDQIDGTDLQESTTTTLSAGIIRESTSVNSSGGGMGIRGGRANEASLKRDGIEISDPVIGGTGNTSLARTPDVSPYAVDYAEVTSSGFDADYGNVLSGVVNTVTKTGKNNKYEGAFNFRTPLPFLYGSSEPITVKIAGTDRDTTLPGYQIQSSNTRIYDFAIGGPIPIVKNSAGQNALTFFLSGRLNTVEYGGNSYEVYDMSEEYAAARAEKAREVWGFALDPLNTGQVEGQEQLVRNVNAKLKYDIADGMFLELGGEIGLTSTENGGWGYAYRFDNPVFRREEGGQVFFDTVRSLLEKDVQATDDNTIINRITAKFYKQLTDRSYFELLGGYVVNNFEIGKKDETKDYGIFDVYDIPNPEDRYTVESDRLIDGDNGAIDTYELPQEERLLNQFLGETTSLNARNLLTGFFEGPDGPGASRNPYGTIDQTFATHGNTRSLEVRETSWVTLEGKYASTFKLGDQSGDGSNAIETNLRAGFDFSYYTLRRHNNSLPWDQNPFFDVYGFESTYFNSKDTTGRLTEFLAQPYHPYHGSFWAQTKFKYKNSIVISPGLRFDFFNPNTQKPPVTRQGPDEIIGSLDTLGDASMKFQVSPRLGISYPITDRSNFRVNFAMMFDMPVLNILYDNAYGDAQRGNQLFGNPDIEPEKVVVYDLGYEARIGNDYSVDVTAFYRDIFNQSGVTYIPAVPSPYIVYTVQEYGNVRGLELSLRRDRKDNVFGRINYTLQRAAGTASSPSSNYGALTGSPDPYTGELPNNPLTEFPLSYDQTHSFNGTFGVYWNNNDGPTLGSLHILENTEISVTTLFGSGLPYTATNTRDQQVGEFNANRFPSQFNTEGQIRRSFMMKDIFGESAGNLRVTFYVQVYNILNNTDPISYYTTTGSPDNDGTTLNRLIGEFPATQYYDRIIEERPETYDSRQYDSYGDRYYNPYADANLDGVVTQLEKYEGYQRLVATIQSRRGNYATPRTITAGVTIQF